MKTKNTEKAFTLIEVLVCTTIVGLLASILMPALSRAKISAKCTVSKNNLRQITTLWVGYAHDNDHTIPYSKENGNAQWAIDMASDLPPETLNSPLTSPPFGISYPNRDDKVESPLEMGSVDTSWGAFGMTNFPRKVAFKTPVRVPYKVAITKRVKVPIEVAVTNRVTLRIPYVVSVTNKVRVLVGTIPKEDPWVHLVGVHDRRNNQIRIFVNGAIESSKSCTISNQFFNSTSIGRWNIQSPDNRGNPWGGGFHGQIDDVAVYSRALSDQEVIALCQDGAASIPAGLAAHYPFNGNANDTSGHGRHGSAQGPVLTKDRNGQANAAYNFDGVDDQILIKKPIITNNSSSYTTSAWVRKNGPWHNGVIMSDRPGPGGPSEGYKYILFMSYRGDFVAGVHNATPWSPPCWTRSKRYSTWPQPKKYEIQEKVSKETRYRIQYKKVVSRQTRFVWQNKTTYETRYRTEYVTHYKTKHVRKRSKELISSSYSINAWAQEGNPLAESKREQFYFRWELGNCETPAFTEGIWADVMPRPTDKAPSTLYGEDDGMSRICINRYGNYANNVAFFDGSVRSVKLRDLWTLPWYRGWKAPDKLPQLPSR